MIGPSDPRFSHHCRRAHALGPRPFAELLAEIADATGAHDLIEETVETYASMDPETVRALGGDRFPPLVVEVVR